MVKKEECEKEKMKSSQHALIARKVQKSHETTYVSHDCNPYIFYCNDTVPCGHTGGVRDLAVGTAPCPRGCDSQNICLQPDRSECFIGLDSKGQDPLRVVSWDERAPNLRCVFDLDRIDRADQLTVFRRKFNLQDDDAINNLMGSFCSKHISNDCLDDSLDECSRYRAKDEEGTACRNWMAAQTAEKRDALMLDYCLKNDTRECKCINRWKQPDFDKSVANLFVDHCWYKPCSSETAFFFVPSTEFSDKCDMEVCQQIVEAHASGSVNVDHNYNEINCNFTRQELETKRKQYKLARKQETKRKARKEALARGEAPPEDDEFEELWEWFIENWQIVVGIALAIVIIFIL